MERVTPKPSRKKHIRRKVVLSDGTVAHVDQNRRTDVTKGGAEKHDIPKEPFSTETGRTNAEWEVKDDYDSTLPYPPPSNHPYFRKLWAQGLENITSRENFKQTHLGLFETLCRLQVELRTLDDFIMANGHVFRVVTVLGEQRRMYPEVQQRLKVLTQIATYSKLLDLVPRKDKSRGSIKDEDEEEWG